MGDQSGDGPPASVEPEVKARLAVLTLGVLAACTSGKGRADTSSAPPAADTVKPAPGDSVASRTDTTPAPGTSSKTSKTTTTTTTTTRTTTPPPPVRDTHLGRDSVIRFPLNDPRHRIPVVKPDSTKPPR
jgi:hypothetical protein